MTGAWRPTVDDENQVDPAPLIDVNRIPLADLLASDDTVLAAAVRRVLTELDRTGEIIAGFGSYAD
jgi:FXSXX-COOH protein